MVLPFFFFFCRITVLPHKLSKRPVLVLFITYMDDQYMYIIAKTGGGIEIRQDNLQLVQGIISPLFYCYNIFLFNLTYLSNLCGV